MSLIKVFDRERSAPVWLNLHHVVHLSEAATSAKGVAAFDYLVATMDGPIRGSVANIDFDKLHGLAIPWPGNLLTPLAFIPVADLRTGDRLRLPVVEMT